MRSLKVIGHRFNFTCRTIPNSSDSIGSTVVFSTTGHSEKSRNTWRRCHGKLKHADQQTNFVLIKGVFSCSREICLFRIRISPWKNAAFENEAVLLHVLFRVTIYRNFNIRTRALPRETVSINRYQLRREMSELFNHSFQDMRKGFVRFARVFFTCD